jgi:hypothetical protein
MNDIKAIIESPYQEFLQEATPCSDFDGPDDQWETSPTIA